MNGKFDIKKYFPIILGAVGIIIILFAGMSEKKTNQSSTNTEEEDLVSYTEMLEDKIKRLCEACDGVD